MSLRITPRAARSFRISSALCHSFASRAARRSAIKASISAIGQTPLHRLPLPVETQIVDRAPRRKAPGRRRSPGGFSPPVRALPADAASLLPGKRGVDEADVSKRQPIARAVLKSSSIASVEPLPEVLELARSSRGLSRWVPPLDPLLRSCGQEIPERLQRRIEPIHPLPAPRSGPHRKNRRGSGNGSAAGRASGPRDDTASGYPGW